MVSADRSGSRSQPFFGFHWSPDPEHVGGHHQTVADHIDEKWTSSGLAPNSARKRWAYHSASIRQLGMVERAVIGWAGKAQTAAMARAIAMMGNAACTPEGGSIGHAVHAPKR
ncbi:MAG: hypothetical protein HZY78_00255 [Burkholderiaceae bacterium]|nr:MAG: hypothetical protein HZY78_00255 [Burkholderiaceae bacterium]